LGAEASRCGIYAGESRVFSKLNGFEPRLGGCSGIVQLHEIVRLLESGWGNKHILVVGEDILHVGHIALLENCRRLGGKLVVGINTDASVSVLKGPSRPIVGEGERARVLAALAATDAVVTFDAPTPIDLIVALRPDVLVKGGDYTKASVVGAAEVRSWGGRVVIVPTVEGFSTNNIVHKLAHSADRWLSVAE
jgi:rfaE bifunctional protein nucleotidyltransferase chain/domain